MSLTHQALIAVGVHYDKANSLAYDLRVEYKNNSDREVASLVQEWADDAPRLAQERTAYEVVSSYREPRTIITFAVWERYGLTGRSTQGDQHMTKQSPIGPQHAPFFAALAKLTLDQRKPKKRAKVKRLSGRRS